MARSPRVPKYRLHKPSGKAVVTIRGRDVYLGEHGTPESHRRYKAALAEWAQAGEQPIRKADDGPVVAELLVAFLEHAEIHYRRADGSPTGEITNIRLACRPLRAIFGTMPCAKFGPAELKRVRQAMIDDGLSRNTCNQRAGIIRRIFKWGVEECIVPPTVLAGLQAVRPLARNRTEAPETEQVRPVPDAHVDALTPHVAPVVWAMIELQRLTGMRSGELVTMRAIDIEMTGKAVWIYRPAQHKTQHHGSTREVYLGPKSRAIIAPYLRRAAADFLFSPAEAERERAAERRRSRKTPVQPSQQKRSERARRRREQGKGQRQPGERYTPQSYARAIAYGCKQADVPHWSPHRLRHNAGTNLRREFGLEVAKVMLGHSSIEATQIYAEADRTKALEVAARIG